MDGDVLNVLVKETCNATNSYGSTVRRGVTLYSCIMLRRVQVRLLAELHPGHARRLCNAVRQGGT